MLQFYYCKYIILPHVDAKVHLNEELLGRLASPKAASIRRYDGHLNIQRLRETAGVKGC